MNIKKLTKKLALIGSFLLLGASPFVMSATNKILDVEIKLDDEQKNVLSIDAQSFYEASLNDNAGLEIFLSSLKNNALVAMYRKDFAADYKKLIEDEEEDFEAQRKSYRDLYGEEEGAKKLEEELEDDGFDTEEEYLLSEIRSTILGIAFNKLYEEDEIEETDDNGTPDDTSDDEEIEYDVLSRNHLFWYDDWFKETRPLHVSAITFDLDPDEDGDFNVVEMKEEQLEKFNAFIKEVKRVEASTTETALDFSLLATAYSSTNASTNGHIGLLKYNENQVADVTTRYNAYNFINDVSSPTMRTGSKIDIDENLTGETFLTKFKTGERDYFYLDIKQEKFLVTRTADNKISIMKFFGMKEFIDPDTRADDSDYKEYFKTAPKRFKKFSTKPFDMLAIMKSYAASRSYNEYILAVDEGVIQFEDEHLISDQVIKDRIQKYIDNKYQGLLMRKDETFIKTINDQNEAWKDSDYKDEIDTTSLKDSVRWLLWG